MQAELSDNIQSICRATDRILWETYARCVKADFSAPVSSRLVFPRYERSRPGKLRVSEQEARFAFVESLAGQAFLYSVETPTQQSYQQTGSKPLSAQTDLTLFDQAGNRICNVEFKCKGVSPRAENHFKISKDLEKLLREPVAGLWFHLFESAHNSTLPNLLSVIAKEIKTAYGRYFSQIAAPCLGVHICVLKHGISLHGNLPLSRHCTPDLSLLCGALRPTLRFSRDKVLGTYLSSGWNCNTHSDCPGYSSRRMDEEAGDGLLN